MKAVLLTGFEGTNSLQVADVPLPAFAADEVLIKVKAAGINYAEVEQIHGRYLTFGKELPFVMGFEVSGMVSDVGSDVKSVNIGDRVTTFALSGGFAEYATAKAHALIPIPGQLDYGEAITIPLQGMTAYTMLKYQVLPCKPGSILIQAAAGGVGIYLVQLAKAMGIKTVIALAGSDEKLQLATSLGADAAIDYTQPGWADKVKDATYDKGVDVVLQMLTGKVGEESFKLIAPGGRIVLFGAQNYHDTITTEQVRQLIWQNQTLAGFAFPALDPQKIQESIPELLELIAKTPLRLFAQHAYSLDQAAEAFELLQSRKTTGKVFFRLD
ncbi:quinone oxidoreductase family protein [Mucilaginibacter ginsenosidivorans]|uniref:NADPH:quinone oxidoreductase family protein n=1 Tax=Mucilaginibacter ginsenosidivorans TaxID=398053 RepID=A0A5B8UUN4_9SPHI|nr:NADPH:quinone oxidoreductase family protein [Mucilaginibacter ginsenosidivorans]QEC62840.1 NADPH:quinone oxidoreductase family protein [Mucilaginibacter ginsenosidivorans]